MSADEFKLAPCPFCGGEPYLKRRGAPHQSCIVVCSNCGCRHESGDEGEESGTSWNRRADTQRELNLSTLVKHMAVTMRKPHHIGERKRIAEQALDALRRWNLLGSPLREEGEG